MFADSTPRHAAPALAAKPSRLQFMRFRDRWEDVLCSLLQLVFGSYMV